MSPFSRILRELRMRHGMRQGDLADAMGYEQTYKDAVIQDRDLHKLEHKHQGYR